MGVYLCQTMAPILSTLIEDELKSRLVIILIFVELLAHLNGH